MNLTGAIMCGGKSTRMGFDKTKLIFENNYLMDIQINLLKKICSNVILVTDTKKRIQHLKSKDTEVYEDVFADIGPLSGVYTALKKTDSIFAVGCDMPNIDLDFISFMFKESYTNDCVIPVQNNFLECLYGIYNKSMLDIIEENINNKIYGITHSILKSNHKLIDIDKFGISKNLFINFNNKNDLNSF